MKNRVLVTGINGFMGGALAGYFSRSSFTVNGLSRKQAACPAHPCHVTSYEAADIARILGELTPSVIIHAAGSASVGDSFVNPSSDFNSSVRLTHSLLEGVRLSGQKPLVIYLSSAAVYGNPAVLPVSEDAAIQPISPYGYHKRMCEYLAQEYALCHGIPVLVARLFSVFGPTQRRLLLWELFEKFRDAPVVTLQGTGNETRDYLYIDDVAEALIRLIPKLSEVHSVINIASGVSISVREVAEKIKSCLNSHKKIEFGCQERVGNPARWEADISRYSSIAGKQIYQDFDQMLKWTVQEWTK